MKRPAAPPAKPKPAPRRRRAPALRTEREKMLAGLPYLPSDPELQAMAATAERWMARYNAGLPASPAERLALLRQGLGAVGDHSVVRPPFHCDYGVNITLGTGVFINFNCIILDVVAISIGDGTRIGPGVQLLAADHPRDAAARRAGGEFGRPITIGPHVWVGGGALILPGVTIGEDAVVGAGAVVTRSVPAGATVLGNPARPPRKS